MTQQLIILGINPREVKNLHPYKHLDVNVHGSVGLKREMLHLARAQKVQQPNCPSNDDWIHRMHSMQAMEVTQQQKEKKSRHMLQQGWILETCEAQVSHEKMTYCMIPSVWNVQNKQIQRDGK